MVSRILLSYIQCIFLNSNLNGLEHSPIRVLLILLRVTYMMIFKIHFEQGPIHSSLSCPTFYSLHIILLKYMIPLVFV